MKTPIGCLALLLLSLGATAFVYAHGEKKHTQEEDMDYDAVENEFGSFDPALKPDRTIAVSMTDNMRFTPASFEVKAGEVIEFVVSNDGKLQHEFVLGTPDTLAEHNELMKRFPNMEHEEPYMAHVDPDKSIKIIWQFSKSGTFEYGCLLPGHFDAGMRGTVAVK